MIIRKKSIFSICLAAAALAAGAIMLSGFTFAENSDEESPLGCSGNITAPSVSLNEEAEPELSYRYLRGTMYKNLYEAGYRNLFETTLPEEIIPEELPAEGGNYQTSVGGAANPGYSGSVGSYSLNDKTIAAHLTVQGTSIQDRAIWQCSTSTSYYEPSSVAWAAKTANLRSGELSQNTVIYGHNWNNCFVPFKKTGSQFESLMAFTYEDFVEENQYIYLTTNSGVHTFRIFAVSFTTDLSFYINCNNIDVVSVANTAMKKSLFDFGVSVSSSDKLITLSTCTRYYKGLGANQRFIIMGKLVD